MIASEIRHWVWETNYGLIFQSGVLVAVIVGTAIVYQVLASEVASRMPEFATLKAIGYDNAYLIRVMVQQSLLLAMIAFAAAWTIAAVLYEVTAERSNPNPHDVAQFARRVVADRRPLRRFGPGRDSEGLSSRSRGAVLTPQ